MKTNWLLIIFFSIVIQVNSQNKISKLEQTINPGEAKNIKALIKITGGVLKIKGGSNDLANVNLSYDKSEWNPSVSYTENEDVGKLVVKASSESEDKHIDGDNKCNIILNEKFNYSLGVVLGAGEANMNFENFNIKKALFKLGVGSFKINLANTSIPLLKIEAGIGEATLDISGDYKNNLKAQIKAGIGELKIIVPENMGVKFIINGFLGDVSTPGYNKKGQEYTNDKFGDSKYSIIMKINGAIGSIEIIEK